jgi:hypothetical protein
MKIDKANDVDPTAMDTTANAAAVMDAILGLT